MIKVLLSCATKNTFIQKWRQWGKERESHKNLKVFCNTMYFIFIIKVCRFKLLSVWTAIKIYGETYLDSALSLSIAFHSVLCVCWSTDTTEMNSVDIKDI